MNLEAEDVGIVFLGNFNPAIFHPEWLFTHGLISESDRDYSIGELKVVHKTVTEFLVKPDMLLLVTDDRFQLRGDFKWNHEVRDLTVGIFSLLEHCPITAMGVNRSMHFRFQSPDDLQEFFNRISRVNHFSSIIPDPVLKQFELLGKRPDNDDGYISIQISHSQQIIPGTLIHINSHHGRPGKKPDPLELAYLLKKLETSWDEMMSYALKLATKITEVQ